MKDFNEIISAGAQLLGKSRLHAARLYEAIGYSEKADCAIDAAELFYWYVNGKSLKLMYFRGQFGTPEFLFQEKVYHHNPLKDKVVNELNSRYWEWSFPNLRQLVDKAFDEDKAPRQQLIHHFSSLCSNLSKYQIQLHEFISFLNQCQDEDKVPVSKYIDQPMDSKYRIIADASTIPLSLSEAWELARHVQEKPYTEVRLNHPESPNILEQPAMLSNLSYSNIVSTTNLSHQNAVSNQQSLNELGITVLGKAVNTVANIDPMEARSASFVLTGNEVADNVSDMKSVSK